MPLTELGGRRLWRCADTAVVRVHSVPDAASSNLPAALISMTTMNRMMEEERGQIGSIKALGYGNADAFFKYFGYAALATLIGSCLGAIIGFQFFPRVIFDAYSVIDRLPPLITAFYSGTFLQAVVFSLIATLGGVAIAAVRR